MSVSTDEHRCCAQAWRDGADDATATWQRDIHELRRALAASEASRIRLATFVNAWDARNAGWEAYGLASRDNWISREHYERTLGIQGEALRLEEAFKAARANLTPADLARGHG